MLKDITIGSDPEFIIFDPKNKISVPSTKYTDGTKEEPSPIGEGFFLQRDNALIEGNIPPVTKKIDFIESMNYLMGYINFLVKRDGHEIIHEDTGFYREDDLMEPEMLIFGCQPFRNAWTNSFMTAPDLGNKNFRTCGFHIHIGYTLEDTTLAREEINKLIAKAFDLTVILPSYKIHLDKNRLSAYGGIGQYRDKPYGVECRSLGGFFTNPSYLEWVWDRTMEAIQICNNKESLEKLYELKPLTNFKKDSIDSYLEKTLQHFKILKI